MENNKIDISRKQNRLKSRIIFVAVILSMFPLFFVTKTAITVFTQTKDVKLKKIKLNFYGNEPIEVTKLKTNEKNVKLDEEFVENTGWLKNFSIEFKNKSQKT